MTQTENKTQKLTVQSVTANFLTSHNLIDVLDTVKDAHNALCIQYEQEAQDATSKEDYLAIQEQSYDANSIMNTVVTFVANVITLQSKIQ